MQASVAMDAPLGLWTYADDLDDAPTREYVIHRAIVSELEDVPDIVAIELGGREAALAALLELAAADEAREDDTPTRELTVRRFRANDFDVEQLEALAALELGDDDIVIDYREAAWQHHGAVDLSTAIARVLDSAAAMREAASPWTERPAHARDARSWTAARWTVVAAVVLVLEIVAFAALV